MIHKAMKNNYFVDCYLKALIAFQITALYSVCYMTVMYSFGIL